MWHLSNADRSGMAISTLGTVLCGAHGLFLLPRIRIDFWNGQALEAPVRIAAGFLPKDLWTPYERSFILLAKRLGWLGRVGIQFGLQFIAKRSPVRTVQHHYNGAAFECTEKSSKREVEL